MLEWQRTFPYVTWEIHVEKLLKFRNYNPVRVVINIFSPLLKDQADTVVMEQRNLSTRSFVQRKKNALYIYTSEWKNSLALIFLVFLRGGGGKWNLQYKFQCTLHSIVFN